MSDKLLTLSIVLSKKFKVLCKILSVYGLNYIILLVLSITFTKNSDKVDIDSKGMRCRSIIVGFFVWLSVTLEYFSDFAYEIQNIIRFNCLCLGII